MNRRTLLGVSLALAAATMAGAAPALAQAGYPDKPVKLVIPYPPGGPTDLLGRLVAQGLSDLWGKPVVVENKAGASGTIGADYVARSEPDGYTLVLGNNASNGTYELLNPSTAPYITMRDFAPVSMVALSPQVMIISPNLGVKDVKSFVDLARSKPGELNYGSSAIGSAPHLAAEMFKLAAGVDIKHIPFNGAAPVMQAVVSGTVQMYIGAPSTVMPQVDAGKAVLIGALPPLPDVPTFREAGIDLVYNSWFGVLAPAKTPEPVLDKLNADITTVLTKDEIRKQLSDLGFVAETGSRADFVKAIEEETATTRKVIEAAHIEVK